MKNVFKIFGMLLIVFSVISLNSCRSDDDPADNDFFAGTYRGSLSYIDGSTTVNTDNGSVFVTKIASGTKYNFAFSNGIPDLNGIEFQQQGDHNLVMVGSTATSYVKIDNSNLKIFYSMNGRTWTADCIRN